MTLASMISLPPADTVVLAPSDRARRAWHGRWLRAMRGMPGAGEACLMPTFLTLEEWLRRLWEDLRLLGRLPAAGDVVDPSIEQALWRLAAREHAGGMPAVWESVGEEMQAAWRLLNAYAPLPSADTPSPHGADPSDQWRVDLRAGEGWWQAPARDVLDRLADAGVVSEAELARRLHARVHLLAGVVSPHLVLTPQFSPWPDVTALIATVERLGLSRVHQLTTADAAVGAPAAQPWRRLDFRNALAEREAALDWARARAAEATEQGVVGAQVVVVVPDLTSSFARWRQSADLLGIDANFSIGPAVSRYPWAAAGFVAVNAAFEPCAVEELADALTHPRWGWRVEAREAVARATRQAIESGVRSWGLADTLRQAQLSDRLRAVEAALGDFGGGVRRTRAQWAERYGALVAALTEGVPVLDSALLQLQRALHEAIDRWQSLDRWLGPVTHSEGHGELITLTDRSPFQPEARGQAAQVIGLLESAGLPHDGLWFTGATADTLPERVSLNRALDPAWQRRHGVGRAAFANVWARAEALVGHWRSLGPVCIASRTEEEGEPKRWSPLVATWPLAVPDRVTPRTPPPVVPVVEWLPDETAPPDPPLGRARVRDFEQQALCPRRGFITAWLAAEPWPLPPEGVPPRLRGNLLHALAEQYGMAILGRDSRTIDWSAVRASIPRWVNVCADRHRSDLERLPAVVRRAELRRVERIMHRFIDVEQQRAAFRVHAIESPQTTEIGGLTLRLKIDRIDAIPAAGTDEPGWLVVDYKTGQANVKALTDTRLTAPQLAVYALAAGEATVGVAYAALSDDETGLRGLGRGWQAQEVSTADADDDFARLPSVWAEQLAVLADELTRGEAALAPVEGLRTCERCPVRSVCGIDRVLAAQGQAVIGDEE